MRLGSDMDPRLSFMARAAARWWLVENGEMEVDEAFAGLVNDILERKAVEKHFNEIWRAGRQKRLERWRKEWGYSFASRAADSEKSNQLKKEKPIPAAIAMPDKLE